MLRIHRVFHFLSKAPIEKRIKNERVQIRTFFREI